MIAASFKDHWPADHLARLRTLQTGARSRGLRLEARNGGSRTVWLPHLAFWRRDKLLAQHWGLSDAENWLGAETFMGSHEGGAS